MTATIDQTGQDNGHAQSKLATVRDTLSEKTHVVRDTLSEKTTAARDAVHDGYVVAKDKTTETLETAREKAEEAYRTAREKASDAARATGQTIESNPIAALVGGLALGAIAGALVPRSDKEKELLGPIGTKLNGAVREAAGAARDAGLAALDERGLNKDAAKDQVNKLVDIAAKAAGSAGTAAADAVRKPTV
ncbi:hypothetical protein ABC347_04335 [Sphingomonas sp. 1P06PA]|uniref:DUF883 family protein n=1 Tax=Sphingomonas sp. 1P06PA TaxID=554121 RepID=UPI0039A4BF52